MIRLMEMGAKLVVKTLDGLAENSITEQPNHKLQNQKCFQNFQRRHENSLESRNG